MTSSLDSDRGNKMRIQRKCFHVSWFSLQIISILIICILVKTSAAEEQIVVQTWGGAWGNCFKNQIAGPFEKAFGVKVIVDLQESSSTR